MNSVKDTMGCIEEVHLSTEKIGRHFAAGSNRYNRRGDHHVVEMAPEPHDHNWSRWPRTFPGRRHEDVKIHRDCPHYIHRHCSRLCVAHGTQDSGKDYWSTHGTHKTLARRS